MSPAAADPGVLSCRRIRHLARGRALRELEVVLEPFLLRLETLDGDMRRSLLLLLEQTDDWRLWSWWSGVDMPPTEALREALQRVRSWQGRDP
ncbi:MAG: succinate dehydrogenase assembly factor 2 [Magnetococcus sp. WYHC-3]